MLKCSLPSPDLTPKIRVPLWSQCDAPTLGFYAHYLDTLLQPVAIPFHAFNDAALCHTSCTSAIATYYSEIFNCVDKAISTCVPLSKPSKTDYNVPGWNTFVAEKHEIPRYAYYFVMASLCDDVMDLLTSCITNIRDWMARNRLKLNEEKTQIIWLGRPTLRV